MLEALEDLAGQLAATCRRQQLELETSELARVASMGVGDTTFGVDTAPEQIVAQWAEAHARRGPLSILTEDTGWRHLGPAPGGFRELDSFDHGGPRVVVDPVDGSRNLMFDLRSAWAAIASAPPGPLQPRLRDLTLGVVQELGTSRHGRALRLVGTANGACCEELFELTPGGLGTRLERRVLRADTEARVDGGFFPFFRYHPASRIELARIEAAFFERLELHESAELRSVFDDQYISNAGQLVLLAQGRYRMIADLRGRLVNTDGSPSVTSKPYDIAAAVVCARAAGALVEDPLGGPLDTPLDATSPVSFVGYANAATGARLRPHLLATLTPC